MGIDAVRQILERMFTEWNGAKCSCCNDEEVCAKNSGTDGKSGRTHEIHHPRVDTYSGKEVRLEGGARGFFLMRY